MTQTTIGWIDARSRVCPLRISSLAPPENAHGYLDHPGVAITKSISCSVVLSADDAVRPSLTTNVAMWQSFEHGRRRKLAELQPGAFAAERVRSALVELLPNDDGSMRGFARPASLDSAGAGRARDRLPPRLRRPTILYEAFRYRTGCTSRSAELEVV